MDLLSTWFMDSGSLFATWRRLVAGMACATALALHPVTALALSIDEFEDGSFSTSVDLGIGGVATLGGTRDVDVVVGSSDAELVLSPADDSIVLDGSVTLWYDGGADGSNAATLGALGADLGAEGSRFLIEVSALSGPTNITVYAYDGTIGQSVSTSVSSPGHYEIFFSSFGAVDLSDVRTIGLNGGNLSISSFSVVPEPGTGALLGAALVGLAVARRRRRRGLGRIAALAVVGVLGLSSLFPGSASAVPIVDQFNYSSQIDFGAIGASDVRGQTFTVGVEGTIALIRVELTGDDSTLSMGIYATSGGLPTGAPLAVAVNPTDFGSVYKEFDFSSAGLAVMPGEELAFAVSDPTNAGSYRNAFSSYSAGTIVTSTDGGSSWSTIGNRDSNFSVWVQPIPEPSTGLLMGLGLVGLALAGPGRDPR